MIMEAKLNIGDSFFLVYETENGFEVKSDIVEKIIVEMTGGERGRLFKESTGKEYSVIYKGSFGRIESKAEEIVLTKEEAMLKIKELTRNIIGVDI